MILVSKLQIFLHIVTQGAAIDERMWYRCVVTALPRAVSTHVRACGLMTICLTSCADPAATHREALDAAAAELGAHRAAEVARETVVFDGSLSGYVATALSDHPGLRATFERWHAVVETSAGAGRLPDASISYGYFIRSVETRVGPQRHRVSVSQGFPWPGQLSSMQNAASSQALAWQRRYEALALEVRQRVAVAYWRLWVARESERIAAAQTDVLRTIIDTARARVAIGAASVADLQRLELDLSRLGDQVASARTQARLDETGLAAAVGLTTRIEMPTLDRPPALAVPLEDSDTLLAALAVHPRLTELDALAQARELQSDATRLRARPGFRVGVDWIETGRGMSTADDAGKDPVVVQLGLTLPLSQRKLAHEAEASRAMARSRRSERLAALVEARAAIEQSLTRIDDATRRARLYEATMVPQAQAALDSVVGAYVGGRASVADILSAERELLALHLDLARARADFATAWAVLERTVGRPVAAGEAPR